MDLQTIIAAGLEDKLKCFSCHNYLSYFPISSCSNNQSLCGRCEAPEGIICFEDEAFEALSQLLYFPCRYRSEGCREEFLPKDIPPHEKNCRYRVVTCIVKHPTECDWTGSLSFLSSHCGKEHSEVILKNGEFEFDLTDSLVTQYLLENECYFLSFTISFDLDNRGLFFYICDDHSQSEYVKHTYQVKIGNGKRFILFDLVVSVNYDDEESGERVCLSPDFSNDAILVGQISISGRNPLVKTQEISDKVNEKLLPFLKCIKCSQLVQPLVVRCIFKAQPLCGLCFPEHIQNCHDCQNKTSEGYENFLIPALNEIAQFLLYPCKYQNNGCSLRLKYDERSNHDTNCHYQKSVCPLSTSHSCKWSGLKKEISNHILTEHDTVIKRSPFEGVVKSETITCDVVKFSQYLFRVAYCKASDNNYKWSVETVETNQKEFMYEIEILDGTDSGQRFVYRKACSELTPQDKIFDESSKYFYFQKQQVLDFCLTGTEDLKFKIHIVK